MTWFNSFIKENPTAVIILFMFGAGGTGTGLTILQNSKPMATELYVDNKVAKVREELEHGFREIRTTMWCSTAASEVTRLETEEFGLIQDSRSDPDNAYLQDRINKVANAIAKHRATVLSQACR